MWNAPRSALKSPFLRFKICSYSYTYLCTGCICILVDIHWTSSKCWQYRGLFKLHCIKQNLIFWNFNNSQGSDIQSYQSCCCSTWGLLRTNSQLQSRYTHDMCQGWSTPIEDGHLTFNHWNPDSGGFVKPYHPLPRSFTNGRLYPVSHIFQ